MAKTKHSAISAEIAVLGAVIPIGKDNAISGKNLDTRLKCTTRERYALIQSAREAGMIICSCMNGYYRPDNAQEILRYYQTSRKKAISILSTLTTARRKLIADGYKVK